MDIDYLVIPAVVVLVALSGSAVTSANLSWYRLLHVPAWTPNGSVIGAVWTVIYVLAAACALLVWRTMRRSRRFRAIVATFLVNAVLNAGWSMVFFGLHRIDAAVLVAVALTSTTVVLFLLLVRRLPLAALLLLPYAAWAGFATYLNFVIWRMN